MPFDADTCFSPLIARAGPAARIGIALSGGPDSLALLHALAALRDIAAPRIRLQSITIDHGLRDGSQADAIRAGEMARTVGVSHMLMHWAGEKPSTGVQEAARIARYDLLHEAMLHEQLDCVLTAHTRDDQAETLLMRSQRKSGSDAMCGIPKSGVWMSMPVYRPLLDVRREVIEAYCERHNLSPIRDPANENLTHERVRARRTLAHDPACADRLICDAAPRIEHRASEIGAASVLASRHVRFDSSGFALVNGALFGTEAVLRDRVLRALILRIGGNIYPARQDALTRLSSALSAWWQSGQGERVAMTLGGASIETLGEAVIVTREPGRFSPPHMPASSQHRVFDRRFIVAPGAEVTALGLAGWNALQSENRHGFPDSARLSVAAERAGLTLSGPKDASRWRRFIARICATLPVLTTDGHRVPADFRAIAPHIGAQIMRIDDNVLTDGQSST